MIQSVSKCEYLLITVTDLETEMLYKIFKNRYNRNPEIVTCEYGTYYDLGLFGKERASRVFHVKSEMGSDTPGGSLITTFSALIDLKPIKLIMVGIAFGLNNQKIGTVLVSQSVKPYDYKKIGTKIKSGKPTMVYSFRGKQVECPPNLINLFQAVKRKRLSRNKRTHCIEFGLLISGQTLIDNKEYRDFLKKSFDNAIGGEMEGAGVCASVDALPVGWIIVKGICDYADGNKSKNKKSNQKKAAKNSINLVFEALDTIV